MLREREKKITRLHIILFFLVIIITTVTIIIVRVNMSNSTKRYVEFEKELIKANKIYFKINKIKLKDGYEKKVYIATLDKQNLLQNDLKDKCKGYVIASSERNIYTEEYDVIHRAYIKCGNKYETNYYYE